MMELGLIAGVALVLGIGLGSLWMKGRVAKALAEGQQLAEQLPLLQTECQQLRTDNQQLTLQHQQTHTRLEERDKQLAVGQAQWQQQQQDYRALDAEAKQGQQSLAKLQESEKQLGQRLQEALSEKSHWQERYESQAERLQTVQSRLVELETASEEKERSWSEQLNQLRQNREDLTKTFENLANEILEKKGQSFSQVQQQSIESLLKPFKEQIEGFQKRVNEVHTESVRGQSLLESEIKKVLDVGVKMSSEAHSLTSALKGDKKTTGNWGEMQLERTLELAGLVKEVHYTAQEKYEKEGDIYYPDFVVKLPDNKHLIIDSKVSLVDYERAMSAETEAERVQAMNAHVKAVKNHIEGLAKKDYSNLIGIHSPEFVLMFMPIEPAYLEAMKHDKGLFNYGYGKQVVLVSHTTLMPILKTVSNLWVLEKNNASAKEISQKAGEIYQSVVRVADRLHKLGKTIGTLTNHYNDAVTGLVGQQGLYSKVSQLQAYSTQTDERLPELEPQMKEVTTPRLEKILTSQSL